MCQLSFGFSRLGRTTQLTIRQLRLKTVTLLALSLMLRPSNVAPLARRYEAGSDLLSSFVMCTDQFQFVKDGSLVVSF